MSDIDAEKALDAMTGSRDAAMALYRVTASERDAARALADELAKALDRYGRHTVGCDAVAPDMAPWETTTCTCGSLGDVHELSCEKAISFNRHEPKWSRRKPKPCTCGLTAALAKWEASHG